MIGTTGIAQTVIYDNGPTFDLAGGGAAGANASSLHDGMGSYGSGHAFSSGFRVADDFVVAPGTTVTIDSLVFYAYQTGSGPISSITEVNVRIWNGVPEDGISTAVFGDNTTNIMITSEWGGAYRTGDLGAAACPAETCVDRPIMRNACIVGTTLAPGTYWIDWQTNGTGASGPWAPPINLGAGVTTTGNAKQYDPAGLIWNDLFDGALTTEAQGLPFLVVGTITTGINEININNNVTVFPNPVSESTTVTINAPIGSNDELTFTVYDILGNVAKKIENITSKSFELKRGSLANGVYTYEMTNGGEILKNGKIVLQ
ncbi:MAG: T9SS type A sorting domain-containing protein [Bacteroidetes bacterium]|nr:T9SS type A sorting domain-containing protein [Bacteroidota bacterium]